MRPGAGQTAGIPHLVWYHRGERRIVEYGSSLGAVRAAGLRETMRDAIVELSGSHLAQTETTVFETLEEAGLVTGAVNFTRYGARGSIASACRPSRAGTAGTPSRSPGRRGSSSSTCTSPTTWARPSPSVRAPQARSTPTRSRWPLARHAHGFDFLVYYLPDYDYASAAAGPEGSDDALRRADRAVAELLEAAGGCEAFLERYAIVVCADHGQTAVRDVVRLEDAFSDLRVPAPRSRP